jgi:hypothetical protein
VADYCPPPQAFANWNDFVNSTQAIKGETALQTAKRFRLAEMKKNASGQRLWMGLKECRDQQMTPPQKAPERLSSR